MSSIRSVISSLYKKLRPYKLGIFLTIDALLCAGGFWLAFLLRFDGMLPAEYLGQFASYEILVVALTLLSLGYYRLYSFSWDLIGLHELAALTKALVIANGLFGLLVFAGHQTLPLFSGFPRSVIFINFFLSLILIGGLRISKRFLREVRKASKGDGVNRMLIVGAGREAEQLLRTMLKHRNPDFTPVGLVGDHKHSQSVIIHGIPVLGAIADIPELVEEHGITHLVIALTSAEASTIQEAVKRAREGGVQNIRIIPDTYEMLESGANPLSLREVQLEDLLGRNPAQLDTQQMREFIKDRVVLVTGACGSIGSELCRQLLAFRPKQLILLDFNESGIFDLMHELKNGSLHTELTPVIASICDAPRIEKIFARYKPAIVFHAAAYKHVPLMEDHPEEAIKTNVVGTATLAQAALAEGAETFVLISTDKAVRPRSVMGKTKRAAEHIVQALNTSGKTKFVAVRFGNVIGSRGSVVPLFQDQIRRRLPVTVTHPEMTRYFMTIREAALLVMEAGAVGKGGEIFALDMGEPVRILDLAHELIRLSGLEPDKDIPITFTGPRPGEKITEELFDRDDHISTKWEKVLVAEQEATYEQAALLEKIQVLGAAATSCLLREEVERLLELLSTFANAGTASKAESTEEKDLNGRT